MATERIRTPQGSQEELIYDNLPPFAIDQLNDTAIHISNSHDLIELFGEDEASAIHTHVQLNKSSFQQHNFPFEDPLFDKLLWCLNTFPALAFPVLKPEQKYRPTCHSNFEPLNAKKRRLSEPPFVLIYPKTCKGSPLSTSVSKQFSSNRTRRQVTKKKFRLHRESVNKWNASSSCNKERGNEPDGFAFLKFWFSCPIQVTDSCCQTII